MAQPQVLELHPVAAPTPDELVAAAAALVPMLREQQDEADRIGHYVPAVHQAMLDAGLYRIVQPKMFGGLEMDLTTLLRVTAQIARGHPSSGWCYCLSASHSLALAAHWPEETQREFFGPDGDFRAPHRSAPAGTFTPVEGGYRISGTWSYSSGIPYATHFCGGGMIPRPDGTVGGGNFFVARDKVTVLEDWGGDTALGMQGSGSNSVRLDDVFVPDAHVSFADVLFGQGLDWKNGTVGSRLHRNPRYLGVVGGAYQLTFSAILTGAARAALEEYEDAIRVRKVLGNPKMMMVEDLDTRRNLGEALTLIECAEAIMYGAAETWQNDIDHWDRTREPMTPEHTIRLWAMARQSSLMACQAVELMFHTATPQSANRGQRLQRYFRDVQMFRIHPSAQNWLHQARGETHLGDPPAKFALRR